MVENRQKPTRLLLLKTNTTKKLDFNDACFELMFAENEPLILPPFPPAVMKIFRPRGTLKNILKIIGTRQNVVLHN
jgi:hypothetical protein